MLKSKWKLLIFTIVIGLLSTGCTANDSVNRDSMSTTENRFSDIGDSYRVNGIRYSIVHDTVTHIIYMHNDSIHKESLTVMYNSEGEPMTLDEYERTK